MLTDKKLIQPVQEKDISEITHLFEIVIKDNFKRDGIDLLKHDLMLEEIDSQKNKLISSFNSSAQNHFYKLIINKQIIAVLAYGYAEPLITDHLIIAKSYPEIKSFMIIPEFQKKGIGRLMFEQIIKILHQNHETNFCLDCGYRCSQSFWKRMLGDPSLVLKDFWEKGYDHLIWARQINQFIS